MDYAEEAKFDLRCVFNDADPAVIGQLKENLKGYEKYVNGRIFCDDANKIYPAVLKIIGSPTRPSLFYLDPFYHDQLPFSTVKGIANFKSDKNERRPELIINLMIEPMLLALKRNTEKDFNTITDSLGTDSWRMARGKDSFRGKTHILFHDIYKEQLELLGYKVTSYYISSTQSNSPMYYLFFATYNDKVYALHKQIKPQIETLKGTEWVKKNFQIQDIVSNLADGRQKGLLDEY